jgi:hypothetical protein
MDEYLLGSRSVLTKLNALNECEALHVDAIAW